MGSDVILAVLIIAFIYYILFMIVFKLCVGNDMYRINRHIQPSSCLQHLYVHKQAIPKKVGLNFKQKLKTHSPSDGGAINKRKGASKTQFSAVFCSF